MVAGCDDTAPALPNGAVYPPGSEVRVHYAPTHALTTDETPVRTDLYPYQAQSDIVTGPPLSFVFPKSAYASFANLEGGPQAAVSLRIDRETMMPIGSLLKDRSKWSSQDIWREHNEKYARRNLNIDISSNYSTQTIAETERAERVQLSEARSDELCGLEIYRETPVSLDGNPPPVMMAGRFFPPGSYRGVATDKTGKITSTNLRRRCPFLPDYIRN